MVIALGVDKGGEKRAGGGEGGKARGDGKKTYRPGPVQHPHAKIPQTDPAILADTAKTIVLVIASPRVERHRGHPGVVALAAGYQPPGDGRAAPIEGIGLGGGGVSAVGTDIGG